MAHRVAANLVVGSDGSTTLRGSSAGLSFPADRLRFHQLRREFGALLIGGNTAANEPYAKTPVPLIVLSSRQLPVRILNNPLALGWNLELKAAIAKATATYGDLLIEAGPKLILQAKSLGLLTEIFLTISDIEGGEHPIDLAALTLGAVELSQERVQGGLFLHYGLAPSHL